MCIKGGFILQPRAIDESGIIHEPPVVRELWFYLLRKVNYLDNGKHKRGQGFFSLNDISEDLHWKIGYRKVKYSKSQISKALRKLHEGNMIETLKETRGVLVTVCKYEHYQNIKNYEGNDEGSTKVDTISKEIKEYNNSIIIDNKNNNIIYAKDGHLSITWDEMNKLIDEFGEVKSKDTINKILNYRKNSKYKSLYRTAITWLRKEAQEVQDKKGRLAI
jgi:hypothetical protein